MRFGLLMPISSIKALIARNALFKRLAIRALAALPALDMWIRNRVSTEAYRPSGLKVGEKQLPHAAIEIHQKLLTLIHTGRKR